MKTAPCRDCGEPTRVYADAEEGSARCEDCSGRKRLLMDLGGTLDRSRRGVDPVWTDRRYDG